jgi:hypothetical protein
VGEAGKSCGGLELSLVDSHMGRKLTLVFLESFRFKVREGIRGTWLGLTTEYPESSCQWFMPVILATQEAEIRRIVV